MRPKRRQVAHRTSIEGMFVRDDKGKWKSMHGPTEHPRINESLEYISNHFFRPIQLKDLVVRSGMSRRGFHKAFRSEVGANPGAVLRQMRIEHAKYLLVEQDLKLDEIAKRCGFRSQNSFCVAFLRAMGVPPKKFQRQYLMSTYRYYRDEQIHLFASNRTPSFSMTKVID